MIFTETEKVELKQKFNDALPKEIVAFLNTDGGTIYIGVNDDGSICGVIRLDETLKKIADILENQVLPDPRACVEVGTKYIDEKHVVEIKVKKGDRRDMAFLLYLGDMAKRLLSFWISSCG